MSVKSANVGGIIRGPIIVRRQCPIPKPSSLIPTTVPSASINYQIKRAQGFWTDWNSEKVGVFHVRGDLHRFGDPWKLLSIVHRPDQFYTVTLFLSFPISCFVESINFPPPLPSLLRPIIDRTLYSFPLSRNLCHGKKKRRIGHESAEKLFEPRKLCEILIGVITRVPR